MNLQERDLSNELQAKNFVLRAFDTLFNKRDYDAARDFWSSDYVQHSAHIPPGRDGLFNLVKALPPTLRYEHDLAVAEGDYVLLHGRFSGIGEPKNWVVVDVVRLADGLLAEHWDVVEDEAARAETQSGLPMFGDRFPQIATIPATYTHDTVPTRYVEADGVRYAYRRFGNPVKTPLVFVQHFRGNMDNHDPAITDALAVEREIVLFDNRGVAGTNGTARETVDDMARDTAAFIAALGLHHVDVLAHSMGGEVAQMLALQSPELVKRLILVGTGPRGGEQMAAMKPSTAELFGKTYERQDEMWVPIMFAPTATSTAAGRQFIERIRGRRERDAPVSTEAAAAHRVAAGVWGRPDTDGYAYLKQIRCPTLVVNGRNDIVIATVNSFILQQNLPDAKLVLYPDSGHGSHYQFHEDFVSEVLRFLDGPPAR